MKILQSFLTLALLISLSINSNAQSDVFKNDNNVAIGGYDLVAYFSDYTAVRGNSDHTVSLEGVDYYFASTENAAMFKADPSAYLPAYGGYCAYAMGASSAKFPTDPETFKIRDGKLYLFFNDYNEGKPFNTIVPWNKDEAALVQKANTNWKGQKM